MADEESSTPNQNDLVKAAESQVAQVMNKALNNVSHNATDGEVSDIHKEHQVVEEQVEYVKPMQDPYNKAITYLENHNILQLFQQLTASIVYYKPERPLEYMMQEVERMKKEKEQEQGKNN